MTAEVEARDEAAAPAPARKPPEADAPSSKPASRPAPLFRADALAARADQWLGQTRAVEPWPMKVVAPAGAVVALAVIAFLTFGQYTQRARVQGVLVPSSGLIKLAAPQEARILSLKVSDGDRVAKGEPLYVLDLDRRTADGAASETIVEALKTQREELQKELLRRSVADGERKEALKIKLQDVGREAAQVDRQIGAGEDYVKTLNDELETYKGYLERGITIQRDILDRRSRLMTERTQVELLRRDRVRLDADKHAAEAELIQIDRDGGSKLSEIRRNVAELDKQVAEAEAQRQIQITAPEAGRVTGVVGRAGQAVPAGAPLLTIVPEDGVIQANLYAESSAIGFVSEGAPVMLRYAAFPYQKFGQHPGVVAAISRAALKPEEIENGVPIPLEEQQRGALYRLTVKPEESVILADGKREPLQVGMQVEADIFLDTRPIWRWILNPLFSLRTLHDGPEEKAK